LAAVRVKRREDGPGEAAGSEAAGSEAAGSEAAGSEAAGSEAAGSEVPGVKAIPGPGRPDTETTGTTAASL